MKEIELAVKAILERNDLDEAGTINITQPVKEFTDLIHKEIVKALEWADSEVLILREMYLTTDNMIDPMDEEAVKIRNQLRIEISESIHKRIKKLTGEM